MSAVSRPLPVTGWVCFACTAVPVLYLPTPPVTTCETCVTPVLERSVYGIHLGIPC